MFRWVVLELGRWQASRRGQVQHPLKGNGGGEM